MHRRATLALLGHALVARSVRAEPAALTFPRDHGAHPAQRTEWWYLTGSLWAQAQTWGFQVTFFRSATGLPLDARSRFAARELVFAHVALTDLTQRRLRHDQRIARAGFGIAQASEADAQVALRDWSLQRSEAGYRASVTSESARFAFELNATPTQPVLLQGDAGLSRKGPMPDQTSRYYSEPQLAVDGTLRVDGRAHRVDGRAWLDHEWSDAFMPPQAVGWDWIGMNLDDGSALTAFRLRRADGGSVYSGGSFRRRDEAAPRSFDDGEARFAPGRAWQSATSKARYPVEWSIVTPVGTFRVVALLDDQELDSRGSTGSIYWEGLSDLLDAQGRRVGRGYLEMTGYAAPLRL